MKRILLSIYILSFFFIICTISIGHTQGFFPFSSFRSPFFGQPFMTPFSSFGSPNQTPFFGPSPFGQQSFSPFSAFRPSSPFFSPQPYSPYSSQSFSPFFSPQSYSPFSQSRSFSPFFQPQPYSPFRQQQSYGPFFQPPPYSPFSQSWAFSPFGPQWPNPFIPNPGPSNAPSDSRLQEFDTSNSIVNLNDFISGASGRDTIPPLTNPDYISAENADFLNDNDLLVGVSIGGEDRAYPLNIMNYHEIVNDTLNGTPVAVTWCPLTRSAIVFNRRIGGETLEFGVSGFLYNSNLVMYDREFFGLWPQLWMGAVTGRFSSQNLQVIPSQVTTWEDWFDNHPDTLVLSEDTGYNRDYDTDPYQSYQSSNEIRFPVNNSDGRLPQKSFVIGIRINNRVVAYSLDLIQSSTEPLEDEINGVSVLVFPGPDNTAYITDDDGDLLPGTLMYWFAWSAFNPNTSVVD